MTTEDQANQRRVRPWIAALLTFLGPGVGLFYARRTRAAIWLVVILIVLNVALVAALYAYMITTNTAPKALADLQDSPFRDFIGLAITVVLAIGVWIFVAPRQHVVVKGSPLRLLGYLGFFIVPLLVQYIPAMAVRSMVTQPFRIPAGSMQPTLNVGDYVLVSKGSYGYSRFSIAPFQDLAPHGRWRAQQPERGDIAVFRPVSEPDRDFVKRIVGLPGDRVQMIQGVLFINGAPVQRENLGEQSFETDGMPFSALVYRETLPNGVSYLTLDRGDMELDNTPEYTVPTDSFFVMGDDRDNSADSRIQSMLGFVPFENLVGRVDRILPPA